MLLTNPLLSITSLADSKCFIHGKGGFFIIWVHMWNFIDLKHISERNMIQDKTIKNKIIKDKTIKDKEIKNIE